MKKFSYNKKYIILFVKNKTKNRNHIFTIKLIILNMQGVINMKMITIKMPKWISNIILKFMKKSK